MSTPFRILICDHRGAGIERALTSLEGAEFAVETTSSLRASLARLTESPPNALVVDPLGRDGAAELSALEGARKRTPGPLPLLLISSEDDGEAVLRADRLLDGDAWDVVARSARPEEIALRLRRLLQRSELFSEMSELRHRAYHDDRTDLLRPKAFQTRLFEHFSAAQRHHHDLALVLIDLDRFGAINKEHDHTVGDALITGVGEVIRKTLRVEDVAGRLGGDEFGVLLPYTSKINAARVVNRLRQEIERLSGRPEGAKDEIAVSASIGFETFDGSDVDSVETLRRHAERALRVAKTQGGDRGVYFRSLKE